MSKLHELSPAEGSHRPAKRIGRGPGSGTGKTSGRGHKGQKSRSGGSIRRGFEGGQMPLQRRIPKRGFTPLNREEFQVLNLRDLAGVEEVEITPELLAEYRIIRSEERPVKLLGIGEAPKGLSITVDAASKGAREKIEGAGGTVVLRGGPSGPETEA